MTILNFNRQQQSSPICSNIDRLIRDTQHKTERLEEIVSAAPYVLLGYRTMRNILRSAKRTRSLNKSINLYASESCPPELHDKADQEYCETQSCEKCWLYYITEQYSPAVIQESEGKNENRP